MKIMNIKVYILSLKNDTKRRSYISHEMKKNNLDYVFIDAPDGRLEKIEKNENSMLSNVEAACALGHIKIYNKFLETNDDIALVLEDDITINEKTINSLQTIINDINKKKPDLYIIGGQEGINFTNFFVGKKTKSYASLDLYKSFNSEDYVTRACSYILNRDVAKNLIKINKQLIYVADDWKSFKRLGAFQDLYLTKPSIFCHPLSLENSHLEQSRKIKTDKKNKNIRNKLKKILIQLRINYIKHYLKYITRLILSKLSK